MTIHLTIKNENRPNLRTTTPEKKGPFLPGGGGEGDDLFCGWKQGLSWDEKLSEKGCVKQTNPFLVSLEILWGYITKHHKAIIIK